MVATWAGTPGVPVEMALSKARKEKPGSGLEAATNQGTGDGCLSPLSGDAPPDDLDVRVSNDLPPAPL